MAPVFHRAAITTTSTHYCCMFYSTDRCYCYLSDRLLLLSLSI